MSFALKYGSLDRPTEEVGLIYLDATTQYSRDFSGQVSSHPLANGTQISDHYTRQNPKYNLTAVISGVDINTWTYLIQDSEGIIPTNTYDNEPVSISAPSEGMFKFLPDTLGQFFEPEEPEIIFDTGRTDYTPKVQESLIRLMEGFVYDPETDFWRSNVQLVTLYEFDGVLLKNVIPNLVITSMRFQEDVNSGDALHVSLGMEQVTFSFLRRVKLDQKIAKQFADQAAEKDRKSNASGEEESPEIKKHDPGRTGQSAEDKLRKMEEELEAKRRRRANGN